VMFNVTISSQACNVKCSTYHCCTARYTHLNPNYIIMTVISYTSRIARLAITTARNHCKDQGAGIGDSVGGDIAQI